MRHQINGDYEQAIAAFQAVVDDEAAPDQVREARYRLAESFLLNRDYLASAAAWEEFLAEYPDDQRVSQATLMLARALDAANECASAIPLYQAYLAREIVLADAVYEWMGDCYAALALNSTEPAKALEEAIVAYQQGLAFAIDRGVQVSLREKIAGAYLTQGKNDAAVAEYDAILDVARFDYYRAKIEYLTGQALADADQIDAAQGRYRRAVENYPDAEFAYYSLIELVDAGAEVDEFQRGLVDYHAGSLYPDAYGAAIQAFDRYLAAEAPKKADEALYLKALALRATDQAGAAVEVLDMLIADYPESTWLARAWLEKGSTLASVGDSDGAVKVYQDLAAFFPADELAPRALWRAAKLRESEGAYALAAELFEGVQASFPGFEDADEALWRSGLSHYRAGSSEKAVGNWKTLLKKYPSSAYRAKSLYWLGKLGATPESEGAKDFWDQLVAEMPDGYYALRVQQIRTGDSLTSTRLITAAVEPPPWDAGEAEAEILTWLRGWTDVPTGTSLVTPPVALTRRPDFQRGQAFLAVGLRDEALEAFDNVRSAAWEDPVSLAQLALFFREQGLNGLAARAALRAAGLWPAGTIDDAPLALRYLAYPLVYADLLSAEAQARDLDPLLLAALIRQESLFEPAAESYAGARGLGQVMPATGEGIAKTLRLEGFVLDDLYRPSLSVKFGAFYLAVQMGRFDDQILISLAAYNGGPGNTLYWLEIGGDDLDLFVEAITASQSRLYLQRVYEQFIVYESLYRPSAGERQ